MGRDQGAPVSADQALLQQLVRQEAELDRLRQAQAQAPCLAVAVVLALIGDLCGASRPASTTCSSRFGCGLLAQRGNLARGQFRSE